jgi:hypothetical protein
MDLIEDAEVAKVGGLDRTYVRNSVADDVPHFLSM